MIKLTGLSKEEVEDISRQISDAFYEYKYSDVDQGLLKYIKSREDMFIHINAITGVAYNSGLLYAISESLEGYIMLFGEGIRKQRTG